MIIYVVLTNISNLKMIKSIHFHCVFEHKFRSSGIVGYIYYTHARTRAHTHMLQVDIASHIYSIGHRTMGVSYE